MKALGIALLNCFILVISLLAHRILVRSFNLPINDALFYWGLLIAIFGINSLIFALILSSERKNNH